MALAPMKIRVPTRTEVESRLRPGQAGTIGGAVVQRGPGGGRIIPIGERTRWGAGGTAGAYGGGGLEGGGAYGFGGGAGGGVGAAGGGGGGAPFTAPAPYQANVSEYDPWLKRQAERVEGELTNWEDLTSAEIDRAAGKRRALTEGQRRGMEGIMSQRGQLGTSGAPGMALSDLLGKEASDIAGMTTDITLAEKKRKRDFMLGATGALGAPGESARAGLREAREDYRTNLQAAQTAQAMELERQKMQLELSLAPLRMLTAAL